MLMIWTQRQRKIGSKALYNLLKFTYFVGYYTAV